MAPFARLNSPARGGGALLVLKRHRLGLCKSQKALPQFHARSEDSGFDELWSDFHGLSQFPACPAFPFLQYECVFERGM